MSSAPSPIQTAALTDPGKRRDNNEDSYAVWTSPDHPGLTVAVVCDGVGGANAGELASRMAVESVLRVVGGHLGGELGAVLRLAIQSANRELYAAARQQPELHGMGTTCTVLALADGRVHIAHVGDSRVYHLHRDHLRQLTQDHSLVAELVAREQITAAEARRDARRNIVTRAVGILPEVEVDVVSPPEAPRPGDTFIVCSDGLHGPVGDPDLARLAGQHSLEAACRELVELANARGGPDNITVVLARIAAPNGAERGPRVSATTLLLGFVALAALGCLAWMLLEGIAR